MRRWLLFSLLVPAKPFAPAARRAPRCRALRSSQDGETDDADEAARIAAFRARLMAGGLDAVAAPEVVEDPDEGPAEWARPAEAPATGTVLVGKVDWFFDPNPDSVKARSGAVLIVSRRE